MLSSMVNVTRVNLFHQALIVRVQCKHREIGDDGQVTNE